MFNKKEIHNFQERFFNAFIILSWSLLILSSFGFYKETPTFLQNLNYYISIYICLFLMWRFNPFRTHYEFTNLDRKIAFSAGLFIFTTTALNKYLLNAEEKLKEIF